MNVRTQVRDAFNFSVKKLPLSGPNGTPTPWYALFRSDTMEVVSGGSVTSRYVPHQTEDVLTLVDAAAEAFGNNVTCQCYFYNGHYVSIQPTQHERLKVFGEHDYVWPRLVIKASYENRAFSATMGYYRDLCRNLAMLKQVHGTNMSIRHITGLQDNMVSLISTFSGLKASWANLSDVILRLQDVEVRMDDFLSSIYPEPDMDAGTRAFTYHENRNGAILDRLNRERYHSYRPPVTQENSFKVSAWEAFNAVQGYVQHSTRQKKGFGSELNRALKASNDATVQKAERLAMSLAA